VDEVVALMQAGASGEEFGVSLGRLMTAARWGRTNTWNAVVEQLAPLLPRLSGVYARAAVAVGACVEWGASPLPLAAGLPERAIAAMGMNAMVPELWAEAAPGEPLPEPVWANADRVKAALAPPTLDATRADHLSTAALAWFDMDDWLRALIACMAHREFRDAVPGSVKDQLRTEAEKVGERSELAGWVGALAAVLDDEPVIALDPATRRGYALTMSGVGDTMQFHILLADRLPDEAPGPRPEPHWVAAATDADPNLGYENAAVRRFRLFDAQGAYVFTEGRPADIARVRGARVVVLHPANGRMAMGAGRVFPHMRPSLTLDRVLEPAEAEQWFAHVAPAVENDLMA
jgi:hypothetical protein